MPRIMAIGLAAAVLTLAATRVHAGPPTGPKPHGNPHTTTHATPAAGHGNPHTDAAGAHVRGTSVVPRNQKLVTRLQGMLPNGLSVENAAAGFKNQGQFVAAVHVSNNLHIPFGDLKTQVLADGGSLGKAIHTLKPDADNDREAERATAQAREDLRER
jgi:hypothetical protein